jgi:hypothetical protein
VSAVGISAFVPTGGEADGEPGAGAEAALAAVRHEAATLRQAVGAIQEALDAVTARLDTLDHQLTGGSPPTDGAVPVGDADGPPRPARTVAEWKLSGWTPTVGAEVVNGETLRARREALGVSQAAVAHAAHCSRGLVAEVERGKRRAAQTLAHLAKVLDRLEQQARRN